MGPAPHLTSSKMPELLIRRGVTLAYLLLIYSTLGIVRPVAEFLRSTGILQITVLVLFSVAILLILLWRFKKAGKKRMAVRLGLLVLLVGIAANVEALPEERIHFITYGLLGWLVCWCFENSNTPERKLLRYWILPCLLVWLAGSVDELIQWWLPMRVFDIRDIVFNAVAGMNGIALFATGRGNPP
ncbi:MAG: hypothetical protein DSY50_07730 [Desulfobulbus sp.]|nr:MAG: hypothetical protein DSY50_07730 [Desulfobulbus sp.]